MLTTSAAKALAVLRAATGFVFLWAFLDKTFGFGYATPSAKAWINGGSPTKGFLSSVEAGPLKGFFHDIAGTTFADWGFMIGLLGIGLALVLGIGLRVAAVAGTLMMALMWLAEWPVASGSSNPVVDYHVIYALVGIVLALTFAGHTWGLGRRWARLPLVQKNHWLI
ncbi:DoxX family membrane protein [Actinoplanes oblitus]|uniref:DoxX family membrane protein n=1 Tax=Actinoplanes oblitus TaxID=3040509 RepID=A0ABY8WS88_9ACTN|nr:DoxX family membrane protein [Actinoplanes oblitus]WIN00767.1 DoxX family membrane protein [Actinoplanes oblitus]